MLTALHKIKFYSKFLYSFVQKPFQDYFLHSLWSIQSSNCQVDKKNYAEFSFKAFKSEIRLHIILGLSQPSFNNQAQNIWLTKY